MFFDFFALHSGTVKTQTWQLLSPPATGRGGWGGEHTLRSERTSSVARLRRWMQLSSSKRQHQEHGFNSGAGGPPFLVLRALMALRPRLSWSHRWLMFAPNSSRKGMRSYRALRWGGAGTCRRFLADALWQEVANGLRLLLRFNEGGQNGQQHLISPDPQHWCSAGLHPQPTPVLPVHTRLYSNTQLQRHRQICRRHNGDRPDHWQRWDGLQRGGEYPD